MTAGCGAHAGIPEDLRGTARALLERLRATIEPLAEGRAPEPGSPGACTACPVCALLAALRGERSELAAGLAEHAAGFLAVLLTALDETAATPPQPQQHPQHPARGSGAHRPGAGRSVQRIVVHRT